MVFKKGITPWNKGKKGLQTHSKEAIKKMSEAHIGKIPWNKGKKGVQVPWMKGKHHTKESIEKNRLAHIGKTVWNKGKNTGQIPWNKGKHIQTNTGRTHITKESRAKQIFPIKDTKIETKIQEFLKQLSILFIPHSYMNKIEHSYQCDFFIPDKNMVIEIDGDYWHGNTDNPRFKVLNKSQIKTKELDRIRTKELQEKGYKVLRLWESDIKKMNLEEFKERLGKV